MSRVSWSWRAAAALGAALALAAGAGVACSSFSSDTSVDPEAGAPDGRDTPPEDAQ